jgi:prepilin-type N-terminal cleavage/methylation domain-containing protein
MRNRGMTMVELIVASAITAAIMAATYSVLATSRTALEQTAVEADLAAQAMSILDRIANDLKDAKRSSVSVPNNNSSNQSSITFQRIIGYANSNIQLSNTITYANYFDSANANYLCRRTENGVTADLTDALTKTDVSTGVGGLNFRGSYGDPTVTHTAANGTPLPLDTWEITVQVSRASYSVVRTTKVELRF